MLDELLDLFDRDRKRPSSRRGIRGWIGRLGDDDGDHPSATGRGRHRAWDDDDLDLPEGRLAPVPVRDQRADITRPRRRRHESDWEI